MIFLGGIFLLVDMIVASDETTRNSMFEKLELRELIDRPARQINC